jgi:RNA polymerase sigma factor (TIGR02999 family)
VDERDQVADSLFAGEVTRLLREWKDHGSADAEAALFALVQRELVQVADGLLRHHPRRAAKIDPRELVNEAYLALRVYPIVTANRRPFFRLMATAMRHYLLDLVDHDRAEKRPPSSLRVLDSRAVNAVPGDDGVPVLEWYRAIDALRKVDRRQAEVIEMRIVGLTNEEIALELGISHATVKRDLKQARAFLTFQLGLKASSLQP